MKRTRFKIKPRKQMKRSGFSKKFFKSGAPKKKYIENQTKIWHDKAWAKQSELIRREEKGVCYSCGEINDWKLCQAGHFHHDKLDFDRRNIHCQCVRCNKWLSGNLGNYALHLMEDIGIEGINKLKQDAMQSLATGLNKTTVEDYKLMIEDFERQLQLL